MTVWNLKYLWCCPQRWISKEQSLEQCQCYNGEILEDVREVVSVRGIFLLQKQKHNGPVWDKLSNVTNFSVSVTVSLAKGSDGAARYQSQHHWLSTLQWNRYPCELPAVCLSVCLSHHQTLVRTQQGQTQEASNTSWKYQSSFTDILHCYWELRRWWTIWYKCLCDENKKCS